MEGSREPRAKWSVETCRLLQRRQYSRTMLIEDAIKRSVNKKLQVLWKLSLEATATVFIIIVITSLAAPAGASPAPPPGSAAPPSGADGSAVEQRADQPMPDSYYKMAPVLFGADIISDYFTEPADRAHNSQSGPKQPASLLVNHSKPAGGKRKAAAAAGESRTSSGSSSGSSVPKKPAVPSPKSEPPAKSSSAESKGGANMASVLRDMSKSGASMDQVLSSLELVVEAMKQQTMAMQMISGQMAAKAGSGGPQAAADAQRALLESFGEIVGGFRAARSAGKTSALFDTFGEQLPAGVKGGGDEPVMVVSPTPAPAPAPTPEQPTPAATTTTTTTATPTTASTAPSTSTTTTTTTQRPTTTTTTTTTTSPPSSTTTTAAPTSAAPSSTARYKAMPDPEAAYRFAPEAGGWRRVRPLDFYPSYTSYSDQPAELASPNALHLTDNYRSVAMPGYSSAAALAPQVNKEMEQRVVAMLQPHLMKLLSQSAQQYGAPTSGAGPQPSPKEPEWTPLGPQQQQQQPKQAPRPQPEQQQEEEAAGGKDKELSDEMPRPPGLRPKPALFGLPNTKSAGSGAKGLRIGERPPFDPSNFQLLIAADVSQQKKSQMQKSPGGQADEQAQEAPGGDLSGTASSQTSSALSAPSPEDGEQAGARPAGAKAAHKAASFSILGGRFKITPNTQMLHYLLEPSKALFQQALGHLIGPPPEGPIPPGAKRGPRRPAAPKQQQQQRAKTKKSVTSRPTARPTRSPKPKSE